MDKLVEILERLAQVEDGAPSFTLTNTSRVIRVEAETEATADNPRDAFTAARALVDAIVGAGFSVVNAADIGARIEPYAEDDSWRGLVSIAVWPSDDLQPYHHATPGLGA